MEQKIKKYQLWYKVFLTVGLFAGGILALSNPPDLRAQALEGQALTEGKFKVMNEAEPSAREIIDTLMFEDVTLDIAKNGKVTGRADTTYSDHPFSNVLLSGSATLSLDGEFDPKQNTMSGTFSVRHDTVMKDTTKPPGVRIDSEYTMDFSGTFTGSPNENGDLYLTFSGTSREVGKTESSSGHKEEINRSRKWTNFATFYDYNGCKDSQARFSDFSGHVEIAPPDDLEDWDIVSEFGIVLCEGSAIKTGLESEAVISFADMTTFVMKPETHIILSTGVEQHSKIALVAGNIWMNVKKMVKDGSMEVKMAQAVAGIKGTTLVLEETKDTSTVKIIEGVVEFTSSRSGDSQSVSTGESVIATTDGLGEKATFDVADEEARWDIIDIEPTANTNATDAGAPTKSSRAPIIVAVLLAVVAVALYMFKKKRS